MTLPDDETIAEYYEAYADYLFVPGKHFWNPEVIERGMHKQLFVDTVKKFILHNNTVDDNEINVLLKLNSVLETELKYWMNKTVESQIETQIAQQEVDDLEQEIVYKNERIQELRDQIDEDAALDVNYDIKQITKHLKKVRTLLNSMDKI